MERARARAYRFGAFELDARAGELRKHGVKLRLQEQPFRILLMLLENPGEVVLREEIRKRLWPNDTIVEFDHSINAAIRRLRDALGESADDPHFVETVERRGYRFLGQVEVVAAAGPAIPDAVLLDFSDLAGQTVSHYRVLERLGRGGMGVVYKAQDLKLGREVALKCLSEELTADPIALKRFEREARAASALNHPNICTIYGVEEHDGQPIIAMELVEGETVAERIKRGALPLDEVIILASQMADALEAAHENGIVHRDFKPDNVKIKPDGTVKVLDFGLAKLVEVTVSAKNPDDSPTLTSTRAGLILGTAAYMSPEQSRGEGVDKRSDIWAFGVVLYEMSSGARPFCGDTVSDTLAAVLKTEVQLDAVPHRIRPLVARCLQKDPKQRLRDIGDARISLREMSGAQRLRRSAPTKVTIIRIALAVATLIAALAIFGWWRSTNPMDLSRYRYTPFAVNLQAQSGPIWSPDGKSVAYSGIVNNHWQLFVRSLNALDSRQLTSNFSDFVEGSILVGWSSDGKRVLFASPGTGSTEAILSIAAMGGEPEQLSIVPVPYYVAAMDISPDNQAIAMFGALEGKTVKTAVAISSPLGSPYKLYEPAPFTSKTILNYTKLRFSPNGKKLLLICTGNSGSEEIWLLSFPPGKATPHRVLTHLPLQKLTPDFSWMPDSRHVILTIEMGPRTQDGHLWIADTESDDSYQITGGVTAQNRAAVSPDGRQIVYTEYTDNMDITSVSLIDGKPTKLIATETNERMAAWSANAEKLAYVTDRNGPMEIWMRSADGSDQPLITQKDFPGNPTRFLMDPVLSPDGKRMIFTRASHEGAIRTWITSLSGAPPELLTESASDVEYAGAWSPDGRRFAELASSGSNETLTLVRVGSREKPVILRNHVNSNRLPDWSLTGEWLTFNDDNGWNLISPDGKLTKQLGKLESDHLVFSKDGKLLFGIRWETSPFKMTLFSLDIATLKVIDIHELGRELAYATDFMPGFRFSLTPDGKSITYSTETEKKTLWLLEGFRQPGLLSRLGLSR